jgi:predicted MFS family arabinose efflux permease
VTRRGHRRRPDVAETGADTADRQPARADEVPPRSYTSLLRDPQFAGLFLTQVCTVLATSVSGLYLGTIVNEETGSPFLTSFAIFAPSLANLVSAASLMSVADTRAPRRTMTLLQVGIAVTIGAQALPVPLWARFALLLLSGALTALSAGIRLGLVSLTVGRAGYAPARSLLNLTNGAVQVTGYAFGALLVRVANAPTVFCALAALMALAAVAVVLCVRRLPPRSPAGRPPTDAGTRSARGTRSALGSTHAVNAWVLRQPRTRVLLLALWVPNGLVVGAESLFIPYAGTHAGFLLAAGAAGMMVGDLVVGRFVSRRGRGRINVAQRLLLAVPYLFFVLALPWQLATVLAFVASLGFSASLHLQERLVEATPDERAGQVQGLEASGRTAGQGVCALAAGALAELVGPGAAISVFATASLAVTLVLSPLLRRSASD